MWHLGGCYSLAELFMRVGSSEQMAYWLLYTELLAEENSPPPPIPDSAGEVPKQKGGAGTL